MAAIALTLGLFALWTCLGVGLLALFRTVDNRLERMLLAAPVGLAGFLLTVFLISRGGVPQSIGARPTLVVLLIVAGVLLWRTRPDFSFREYLPFGLIFIGALLVTARPMLDYGFDWLSYSNDDMANYTLGGARTVNYGFFDIPPAQQLLAGQDYSLAYWFFNLGVRAGSELMTGWVAGLTGLSTHQVFMPLIFALHLALISGAGALALRSPQARTAALLTCGLLAISALMALGVLYQLISQVGGLALLTTTVALLMRPFAGMDRAKLIRHGALLALVGAALLAEYPEVVPFLGLSWLAYIGLQLIHRRLSVRPLATVLGVAVLLGVVLLNSYVPISLAFLRGQAGAGLTSTNVTTSLFPFYLIPSGLATVWGFQTVVGVTEEPWLSISILVGAVLLAVAVYAAVRSALRGYAAGIVTVVMFALAAELFAKRVDFGLYKLAMYVQPFMIPTLVLFWLALARKRVLQFVPLLALGIAGLHAQNVYVERSRAIPTGIGGGLAEIPNASGSRINEQFEQLLQQVGSGSIVLDTSNIVLAKFQSVYLRGHSSAFAVEDFFSGAIGTDPGFQVLKPTIQSTAAALNDEYKQRFTNVRFDLKDPTDPTLQNDFVQDTFGQPPEANPNSTMLVETNAQQNLLNRWSQLAGAPTFQIQPWNNVTNELLFVSSILGQPYYTGDRPHVAIYQLEPDYFQQGAMMAGLGRTFLFELVNPSPSFRLVLDMTDTLSGDGQNLLPPAAAVGATREPFPMVGRGSARVFSPPLQPQMIGGRPYVGIDMGVAGKQFPTSRTGLMQLYGRDVNLDSRFLVGFGRDISVVSEDEYEALTPPSRVDAFPSGLWNPQLEYSGVYEDGWLSDDATFVLNEPIDGSMIHIRGTVPVVPGGVSGPTHVDVLVDGSIAAQKDIPQGDFEVSAPSGAGPGKHKVELKFANVVQLPPPDYRPIGAQLHSIAFETPNQAATATSEEDIVTPDSGVQLGDAWYSFETYGGESFRWVNNDAQIQLDPATPRAQPLNIDLETGPGAGGQPLTLQVIDEDTGAPILQTAIGGRRTLSLDLGGDMSHVHRLQLHVEGGGHTTQGDARTLNFRVFSIAWADPASAYSVAELAQFNQNQTPDIVRGDDVSQVSKGQLPSDGILLGKNWDTPESSNKDAFRWVQNDADIVLTSITGTRNQLSVEIAPGPGMGGQPAQVQLLDSNGTVISERSIAGRQVETFDLPMTRGPMNVFRLHVVGGGAATPGDPRILNFRVFNLAWANAGHS